MRGCYDACASVEVAPMKPRVRRVGKSPKPNQTQVRGAACGVEGRRGNKPAQDKTASPVAMTQHIWHVFFGVRAVSLSLLLSTPSALL